MDRGLRARALIMFVIIWRFISLPEKDSAFRRSYRPNGDWAQLFRRARGYVRTDLLHSHEAAGEYLTIDVWESADALAARKRDFADEYARLDRECEQLTRGELRIGEFTVL